MERLGTEIVIDAMHGRVLSQRSDDGLASEVIACIGDSDFAGQALARLNAKVALGAWSAYRIGRRALTSSLIVGGTLGRSDVTQQCWAAYRDGLYRNDASFDDAKAVCSANAVALVHTRPEQLSEPHRRDIYERFHLMERVTLAQLDAENDLFALNFYRFTGAQPFSEADKNTLAAAAPILLAAVQRHASLCTPARSNSLALRDARAQLVTRCERLTSRELDVCVGMLQGWSFEGIAAHFDISPATVKTYRDRAFRRLSIHHRNQLFALCWDDGPRLPSLDGWRQCAGPLVT